MPRKVAKKSARKVVKKSARKVVKKSARKSVVKRSARKSVVKSARKSVPKSARKVVKKSRTSPKSNKAESKQKYTVGFVFTVYNPDDDEEEVNVKELSDNAKAVFSKTIKEYCDIGFWGGFSVKNVSIRFTLATIRVTGLIDKDPNGDVVEGMTLKEAVQVVNDKSVTQWRYGPDIYDVESNGKRYALQSIELS